MGNDRTFKALQKFFYLYKPQLVFLCETKLSTVQMNNVGRKLNFGNYFAVSSKGKSGGITMLWAHDIKVDITSYSSHHIDAEVEVENGKHMRCTGVYGHQEVSQKSTHGLYFASFQVYLHLHGFTLVILIKYCIWEKKME